MLSIRRQCEILKLRRSYYQLIGESAFNASSYVADKLCCPEGRGTPCPLGSLRKNVGSLWPYEGGFYFSTHFFTCLFLALE